GSNRRCSFDHIDSYERGSWSDHADGLSGSVGKIDNAFLSKRTPVIDRDFSGAAVFHVRNHHSGSERESLVRRGKFVLIVNRATGGRVGVQSRSSPAGVA